MITVVVYHGIVFYEVDEQLPAIPNTPRPTSGSEVVTLGLLHALTKAGATGHFYRWLTRRLSAVISAAP